MNTQIHVETQKGPDNQDHTFMDITAPQHVSIEVTNDGRVWVNMNDGCVLRICRAEMINLKCPYGQYEYSKSTSLSAERDSLADNNGSPTEA